MIVRQVRISLANYDQATAYGDRAEVNQYGDLVIFRGTDQVVAIFARDKWVACAVYPETPEEIAESLKAVNDG